MLGKQYFCKSYKLYFFYFNKNCRRDTDNSAVEAWGGVGIRWRGTTVVGASNITEITSFVTIQTYN